MSNVKSDVRDHVRDHVRSDGRDGEPSILHFPFIYAGFRKSMVGMLGLLAKMVNRKNGWITQTPLSSESKEYHISAQYYAIPLAA